MDNQTIAGIIGILEAAQTEIDEYVDYLVGVEGIELSDYQQKKITEPLGFRIAQLKYATNNAEGILGLK